MTRLLPASVSVPVMQIMRDDAGELVMGVTGAKGAESQFALLFLMNIGIEVAYMQPGALLFQPFAKVDKTR